MPKELRAAISDIKEDLAKIRKSITEVCRQLDRVEASDAAAEAAMVEDDEESKRVAWQYEDFLRRQAAQGAPWCHPGCFQSATLYPKRKIEKARKWLEATGLILVGSDKQVGIAPSRHVETVRRNSDKLVRYLGDQKTSVASAVARRALGFDGHRWEQALAMARLLGAVEVERQGPAKVLRLAKPAR